MNRNVDCWHVLLPFLRHLKLNFDSNPVKSRISYYRSQTSRDSRSFILDQFRKCAPALECLMLYWSDVELLLRHCSSAWSSVRQLNIHLESHIHFPCVSLIKRLPTNKAFSQLQYLSFNERRLSFNRPKPLATWIVSCFDALVSSSSKLLILHVNRCCVTYRSFPPTSRDILLTLLTEHIRSRSDHSSSSKIVIDANEEIIISLWNKSRWSHKITNSHLEGKYFHRIYVTFICLHLMRMYQLITNEILH